MKNQPIYDLLLEKWRIIWHDELLQLRFPTREEAKEHLRYLAQRQIDAICEANFCDAHGIKSL